MTALRVAGDHPAPADAGVQRPGCAHDVDHAPALGAADEEGMDAGGAEPLVVGAREGIPAPQPGRELRADVGAEGRGARGRAGSGGHHYLRWRPARIVSGVVELVVVALARALPALAPRAPLALALGYPAAAAGRLGIPDPTGPGAVPVPARLDALGLSRLLA